MDTSSREVPGHLSQRSRALAEIMMHLPPDEREILYKSILIEAESIPSRRTKVEIEAIEEGLRLVIYADDIVSLRAALNSFLRFIDSSLKTIRIISE